MPDRPDYAALIAGQTAVLHMLNSGDGGLPVLNQLLEAAQTALRAAGMSFAEQGTTSGRVVAATGAAEWALGRPVAIDDERLAHPPGDQRIRDVPVDLLPGEVADQLRGRGLGRVLVARAEIGCVVAGALTAYYPKDAERVGPEHHAVLAYLASFIAHLYADQAGLPIHGDPRGIAATADGIAVVDRDGLVRLWNRAAERITGWSAAEVLQRPLPVPVPPPGQAVDRQISDGRWLRITSGDAPDTSGRRIVTLRDITEQRRHEQDHDLFVALTSHELRTPVTVIKGYAETLDTHWDSLDATERREAARAIGQRASELARLVERLLSTANELGPPDASQPVPFDLVEALRAAVADLPATLRERLVVNLPAELPKAVGDRASVATVLMELLTNAEKYSSPGTPVELTAAADERTVVFRVSDRGIGIRPEHVERAFERFWQGESGDRRRYPGVGLGLYLVRKIVERQNGWVSLRPRQKGGTVAEVRLPRG